MTFDVPSRRSRRLNQQSRQLFSFGFQRGIRRKLVCLALLLAMLSASGFDVALQQAPVLASSAVTSATNSLRNLTTFFEWLFGTKSLPSPPRQETHADRVTRVSRIRVAPAKLVAYIGDAHTFTAVGVDSLGEVVHGVRFSWDSDSNDPQRVQIDEAGLATFSQPGQYTITAHAGSVTGSATVLVRPTRRPRQSDDQWRTDQDTLQTSTTGSLGSEDLLPSMLDRLVPTAHAQGGGSGDIGLSAAVSVVGTPRFEGIEPTRLGAVLPQINFNMGLSLVSLGGRGLSANLSLFYNSNVWGARVDPVQGTIMTFDPIQGWPSPGFTLGFGRIAYYDWQSDFTYAYMLIDADGTRHYLGRGHQSNSNTLQTTDGTHITYVGSVLGGGTLNYQDGTKVTIGFVNNRLLPTQVTSTDGNYIQIAYKLASLGFPALAIDHVTDTLGRVIQFNYSGTSLVSISPPAGTTATFSYQNVTMNTNFYLAGAVENVGSSFLGISNVTCANRPPLSFTYSGYGMIYGTSWSSGISGSVTFNYPTGGEPLYGGPTFSQRTESATNSPTGIYTYSAGVITSPDGSKLTVNSGGTEIKNSAGVSFAKTVLTYANDPSGSPQVQSVTAYDDTNTPSKVDYDYDQYGSMVNKREYGWKIGGAWVVRRRTHYTYLNYQQYVDAYIRNRVSQVEVYDVATSDVVPVGKTEYHYDDYLAMGGMETYPGATLPPGYLSSYDASVTTRGNLTGVTKWTDVQTNTSTTHNSKLDKFGNVVKAQVSCCSEKSFTLGENTYWSQPEQVTKGSPTGIHLTSSAVYNFASGTPASLTDPDNQIVGYSYDSSMRPSGFTSPSGTSGSASYNVLGLPTSSTMSYSEGGTTKNLTESAVYNGFGQTIQTVSAHGGQVNLTYDAMGLLQSRTNPFPQGGTPGPLTTYQYDVLGRVKVQTRPGGSTIQTSYSGAAVTMTDQVGRKIKREMDSLGRLVKVTEQDSTGALAQETTYAYNMLDKLTQVNQGAQVRKYKYDASGRLLFEKIPEQTPTIPDGLVPNQWTTAYTYTPFDAVNSKTDARGVVTTYTYDSLNRVTQIAYSVPGGVAPTPTVAYNYDNNQSSATKGMLLSVTVGSDYSESYAYTVGGGNGGNGGNRITLTSVTHSIDSRNYTVNYQYNNANQPTQIRHIYPTYDNQGRLQGVKNSAGVPWMNNIAYNVAGQVIGDTLVTNGTVTNETFGYDANRMQLTSQMATRGSTTLLSLTYNYQATAGQNGAGTTAGNSGQLMSTGGTINGTTESASYSYDLWNRLTTSSQTTNGVTAQRRFAYDRWGNRTGVWDAAVGGTQIQSAVLQQSGGAPTNQLTSVTTNSVQANYFYDASGNVINDGVHSYVYDGENRLVSTDGTMVVCMYDHQNRRVKKTTAVETRHYLWDGSQVLAEYNGTTGAELLSYIYAGRMIAKSEGGVLRYFLSDRLSSRVILDVNGTAVGREAHLPFGETFVPSGEQEKHTFTSYERETETGLDYAVNRGYSPLAGRFQSSDPYSPSASMVNPQSWNRYNYTQNDPINLNDPLGLLIGTVLKVANGCWAVETIEESSVNERIVEYSYWALYGSGCETRASGGGSSQNRSGRPPSKCDLDLPTDPDELDILRVVMHEATPAGNWGLREYANGPNGKNRRTGEEISPREIDLEMAGIAQVLRNYANNHHVSIHAAILAIAHTNTTTGDTTLTEGQGIIDSARLADRSSPECYKLKAALDSLRGTSDIPSTFEHWRGVVQGKKRIRDLQPGEIRHGDTDFF